MEEAEEEEEKEDDPEEETSGAFNFFSSVKSFAEKCSKDIKTLVA